jgi:TRAP-type C4-dicarboxylate transport system substrate-binding protein
MKRTVAWNLVASLALCVWILVPLPPLAEATMTLKFAHVFAPGSLEDKCIVSFAQKVEKRTNGEIKYQIFPAGQLGDIPASYQGMSLGTIDNFFVDITLLGYLKGHEEFFLGQVPYLFNSVEDARRIYNSEIYAPLLEKVRKEKGIRILAVRGDRAPRGINTTKGPIFAPADCKDIKIRVMPIPISIRTFEVWGFKSTPVAWNELFMALKQGLVEGQDNGLDVTVPNKFFEVAKYYAFSDHVYSIYGWYMSEKTYNKIPAKYQSIFSEEAKAAGDLETKLGVARQEKDLDTMLKAGVKVTIPNRYAFREASKDVYKEFEGKLWPAGMVEKIRAAQK